MTTERTYGLIEVAYPQDLGFLIQKLAAAGVDLHANVIPSNWGGQRLPAPSFQLSIIDFGAESYPSTPEVLATLASMNRRGLLPHEFLSVLLNHPEAFESNDDGYVATGMIWQALDGPAFMRCFKLCWMKNQLHVGARGAFRNFLWPRSRFMTTEA